MTTLRFALDLISNIDSSSYEQQPVSFVSLAKDYEWSIFAYHKRIPIDISATQILV